MPTPVPGFDVINTPMSNALGWDVNLPQGSLNATIWINNQSDYDYDLWGNGIDYLGRIPAWMVYVPVPLHGIYSYIEFRFSGQLYAQAAVTETVSAVMYTPTEPGPLTQTPIALPRQTQSIRQERVVAVPIGLSHFYTNAWTVTGGAGASTSVLATWFPTADQLANGTCGMYFYYAWIDASQNNVAAAQTVGFNLQLQWRTAGGVAVGGPFTLWSGRLVSSSSTGDHAVLNPSNPLAAIGVIPATAAKVDIQFSTSGITNTNSMTIGVVGFMDPVNSWWGDAEIGFGNLWTPQAFEQAGKPFPFF